MLTGSFGRVESGTAGRRSGGGSHRLLVALTCGLATLLAGATLLLWAVGRWLVAPLRRLSAQVDAIAAGDPIETARPRRSAKLET